MNPLLDRWTLFIWHSLPASIMFKVEKAACINAHQRLSVGSHHINAEWIQFHVNCVLAQAESNLFACLLYQREAAAHQQTQIYRRAKFLSPARAAPQIEWVSCWHCVLYKLNLLTYLLTNLPRVYEELQRQPKENCQSGVWFSLSWEMLTYVQHLILQFNPMFFWNE